MESGTMITYLTEQELKALKEGCRRGCTLQQLRQHAYKMNNVPEGYARTIANCEIDMLLILKKRVKVFLRTKITPAEMFYVLAYILEETELSNLKTEQTNYKRMSLKFIQKAISIGLEKAYTAYPEMKACVERIDYWWDYANKIHY